jgi:formylglycine-generating enzyme required for sulfatase activity
MKALTAGVAAALILAVAIALVSSAIVNDRKIRPSDCQALKGKIGSFVRIPSGTFVMGANPVYSEEGPARAVFVSSFEIQVNEVTNRQFSEFVANTGYVSEAEKNGGSAVFRFDQSRSSAPDWWVFDMNSTWRTPRGKGFPEEEFNMHPVVHVSLNDARAYAKWIGGRIPTEIEWEYAASAENSHGVRTQREPRTEEGPSANIWTGHFPSTNSAEDGFLETAPVGCFKGSAHGVHDMIGNVWEWTESAFEGDPKLYVLKGGSYLCSSNYCARYRPAARQSLAPNQSTEHLGFRVVRDVPR